MTNPTTQPQEVIQEAKPKRKYVYTKKTGRPPITLNNLPDKWQETIIKLASKGFTECEMRARLCMMGGKFSHVTWNALKVREVEFASVIQKTKCLSEAWWINKARSSLKSKTFQTGAWYACMKNMFGWRDRHEIERTGDGDTYVTTIIGSFNKPEQVSELQGLLENNMRRK